MDNETVQINGISYELNKNDFTARIVWLSDRIKEIYIPRSVKYQSQEYIITGLNNKLSYNCTAKSVVFADDSEVRFIDLTFSYSNIESIKFPPKLEGFKENWCGSTSKLVNISISPKNKNYIIFDGKMLFGKSNPNNENYDSLVFACRNIDKAIIPSFIKQIKSSAFSECKKLNEIEFSENSELYSIEENAFAFLKIRSFFIPSHVEELKDNWCNHLHYLSKIKISSENQNFKYLDEKCQIVVGKSDKKKDDVYDIVIIASRDIEEVFIPSYIKQISSSSFANCYMLKKVDFSIASKLVLIGKSAFFRDSIYEIKIPKSVKTIGKKSFMDTINLKKIEFDIDSELVLIENHSFTGSKIERIFIPSHVKLICKFAFSSCSDLEVVEFGENSELVEIGESAFSYTKIKKIVIPKSVKSIGEFAFYQILELNSFEFEKNSELELLGKTSLAETSIENIKIPSHVKKIDEHAFMNIVTLKSVEFDEDSELTTIGPNAFVESSIETISFPSKIEKLEVNWCNFTAFLLNINISPFNKNFSYLSNDHKIVVGKSNNDSELFDVIVFASRDIDDVNVPSFITKIDSCAFSDCYLLSEIMFSNDSQLLSICEGAFSGCSLESIIFPEKVQLIEKNAFFLCSNLKTVEFLSDSVNLDIDCFGNCGCLMVVSFPNAKNISVDEFPFYFVNDFFTLFTEPNFNFGFDIISDNYDDFSYDNNNVDL